MSMRFAPTASIAIQAPPDPAVDSMQWYDPDAAGFTELTRATERVAGALVVTASAPAVDIVDPHAILAALPAAALIATIDGRIVIANALADAMFRVRLAGRGVDDLVPDGARPLHALLRRAFSSPGQARASGIHGGLAARRGDGSDFPADVSLAAIQTPEGAAILLIVVDTTTQAATVDVLTREAMTDSLTGLGNRAALLAALKQRFGRPVAAQPVTVLAIDLDGLREANQRFGHAAGDDLLRRYAARLITSVRTADTVARTGGDEFVVVCDGSIDAGRVIAARLRGSAVERRAHATTGFDLTASIGIAARRSRERSSTLLRRADLALGRAKAIGRHEVIEAI